MNLESWEAEMQAHKGRVRKHAGFTLVELVVVVMILGILAAVAAPKLLGTSAAASEQSVRHTLAVVRDAIERFAADNGGAPPPGADLGGELEDYLRGGIPQFQVQGSDAVGISAADPLASDGGADGWLYNASTGEFIANSSDASDSGTPYDEL